MTDIITRAATLEPSSFDAEKRTVDVVFSTGASVRRYDFEGAYQERLDMAPASVDLSGFIGGPVLNSHDRFNVNSILGVVDAASVDGQRGLATVRFGHGDEAEVLMKNVQAGIVRAVSVGYRVLEKRIEKDAAGQRTITATRWAPVELSWVALPADPAAKVRSADQMELQEQIRAIAAAVNVPEAFATGLIERNASLDDARTAIIREASRTIPQIDSRAPVAAVTRDANDDFVVRAADGLRSRFNPSHKPEAGREYAYSSISDLARRSLQVGGFSTLGSNAEVITRALATTSDFPNILREVYGKEMLTLRAAPPTIAQVFRRATASDFRARHVMEVTDGPGLTKVNEAGEIEFGKITDKELGGYAVASYAKGFGISFQALVNDDLGALADLSGKMTRGARTWFASLLIDTLVSNPVLADANPVFHASHGNLAGAGVVPSEESLAAAKLAMRTQKDASGNPIDAEPRFVVFSAAKKRRGTS